MTLNEKERKKETTFSETNNKVKREGEGRIPLRIDAAAAREKPSGQLRDPPSLTPAVHSRAVALLRVASLVPLRRWQGTIKTRIKNLSNERYDK